MSEDTKKLYTNRTEMLTILKNNRLVALRSRVSEPLLSGLEFSFSRQTQISPQTSTTTAAYGTAPLNHISMDVNPSSSTVKPASTPSIPTNFGGKALGGSTSLSSPSWGLDAIPCPREMVEMLDQYVVGQYQAKKVLSVGVHNHFKRVGASLGNSSSANSSPSHGGLREDGVYVTGSQKDAPKSPSTQQIHDESWTRYLGNLEGVVDPASAEAIKSYAQALGEEEAKQKKTLDLRGNEHGRPEFSQSDSISREHSRAIPGGSEKAGDHAAENSHVSPVTGRETRQSTDHHHHDHVEIEKSNILILGPTGCGKTLLAKTLARLVNVPFAMADATTLTQAGYVGEDVESVLYKLYQASGYGFVFVGRPGLLSPRSLVQNLLTSFAHSNDHRTFISGMTRQLPNMGLYISTKLIKSRASRIR